MFFTRIGTLLAYIGFGLGIIRTALGFSIALGTENMDSNIAAAQRYLAASNTGEAINEGLTYIIVSVALGILCEISRSRKADASE